MTTDPQPVRTLLVDNYDSYTYNLFQQLAVANGAEPIVVRNDECDWDTLMSRVQGTFDNIVISPGPGRPETPEDFGLSAAAIAWARTSGMPLLGICLGHQGIAVAFGAHTEPAARIMHGQLSRVRHESPLFAGIPQHFEVVRYHSLAIPEPLPAGLTATAWSEDGTVMALENSGATLFGVQFHPESILTRYGSRIIENFRDLTSVRPSVSIAPKPFPTVDEEKSTPLRLTVRRFPGPVDAEALFAALHQGSGAVWLDSARTGRFSYLACAPGGNLWESLIHPADSPDGPFDRIQRRLRSFSVDEPDLPFDFTGGYVGYFGYECEADPATAGPHTSPYPDAALVFADRLVVLDHEQDEVFLVALDPESASAEDTEQWLDRTRHLIGNLQPLEPLAGPPVSVARPVRGRDQYLADIQTVRRHLEQGDTYEVCLTTHFDTATTEAPLTVYRRLRTMNPAPYAAFLDLGGISVSSSSPERFLRIDRSGRVSAKPIKGTRPRGSSWDEDQRLAKELENDVKERAENLMIVDLLRNDLGRVCRPGSVVVPALMRVESFSTVHQLVSTVEGDLAPGRDAVDCVRAAFPGGSMTGAPKVRTMHILQQLEGRARGVYSGAVGFLGVNGTADLSIVIRTLVHDGEAVSVGAGGAVTILSDPEQEWQEVRLKADAVLRAVGAVSSD
ncbi:aminodeoxychorismate synthase component I [Kineosporia sp. NBRC 101731]|uniref:aminodeoxychorismate synthase component I n=1 Tax=Kineosporia sp. NBRC 101731 TaxID=3032199 RepID=UPI0024A0C9D1|nr:aminodeoxychorismate synthase component I [Kineosporia sp. NBRC 101731]GLY33590.1 aminodeoxychorismate synthase, component I [Kineosporia sp. NBRC 101731]